MTSEVLKGRLPRDSEQKKIMCVHDHLIRDQMVHDKMPDSRFLVQTERYSFQELIANSVLPCFATDLAMKEFPMKES